MYTNSPYTEIPYELYNDYTMNGKIPILKWYINGKNDLDNQLWTKEYLDNFIYRFTSEKIKNNSYGNEPYPGAALWILNAIEKYNINNKKVAVIGTLEP